jgi:zinc D-Ala-D-Ala carboxypeptidase
MLHIAINLNWYRMSKGNSLAMLTGLVFMLLSCGADSAGPKTTTQVSVETSTAEPKTVAAEAQGVEEKSAVGEKKNTQDSLVPPSQTIAKNDLLGKVDPLTHPDFAEIPISMAKEKGMYLRKETLDALKKMIAAAKSDGITLKVVSATRPFERQKEIWNKKWRERKENFKQPADLAKNILLYSSMPGSSRHHWGTDLDLNSLEPGDFAAKGKYSATYSWLVDHAGKFGFCQVYSARSTGRSTGYEEERWHWSYMPTANVYLSQYLRHISYDDLAGFEGAATARELDVIKNYVEGISVQCKN